MLLPVHLSSFPPHAHLPTPPRSPPFLSPAHRLDAPVFNLPPTAAACTPLPRPLPRPDPLCGSARRQSAHGGDQVSGAPPRGGVPRPDHRLPHLAILLRSLRRLPHAVCVRSEPLGKPASRPSPTPNPLCGSARRQSAHGGDQTCLFDRKALSSLQMQRLPQIVSLLRLVPLLPFNMMNYLLSVTPVGIGEYMLASWLGIMDVSW
ncbi:hypothetical protein ABZP36_016096 [Zizania latifolia]